MPQAETLQHVRREERERLNPSLGNPSWLILRKRRQLFQKWIGGLPESDLRILDVGGRIQPYRALLSRRRHRYLAIDVLCTPLVNVVARGEQLPLPSGCFDVVFCTQVLEYVSEPRILIAEVHRVLKSGGVLLLSAPTMFPRDSDPEYWRFLPAGLDRLLAAFSSVEIVPEGYSISGFLRTINVFLMAVPGKAVRALLRFTMIPALNITGMMLESLLATTNDQFTVNFSVLAKK